MKTLNVPKVQDYIDGHPDHEEAVRRVDSLFKTRFQNTIEFARHVAHVDEQLVVHLFAWLVENGIAEKKYAIQCPETRGTLKLFATPELAAEPIECDLCDDVHERVRVQTLYVVVPAIPAETKPRATVLSDRLNAFINELQAKVDEPIDTWGDTVGSRHDVELKAKERDRKLILRLKEILK